MLSALFFSYTNVYAAPPETQAEETKPTLNAAVSDKALTVNAVSDNGIKARDPIIIPHFSCHHLRHTFCSRFCENETNIKIIQSVMGHKNFETTMDVYAEVNKQKVRESMRDLAKKMDFM